MTKLLTIAIPTFNRPSFLERQLAWLHQAILGWESSCEIIISDDGSTDNTKDIIEKWRSLFTSTCFRVNVNSQNQGPVKNIAHCIHLATSQYVWIVGDDDDIKPDTLAYILTSLNNNPRLSTIILNYSIYYAPTDKIVCDRYFDLDKEECSSGGKLLLERCIANKNAANGIGFVTSLIYKTETAQQAVKAWLPSVENFEAPAYWTGFCGLYGDVQISQAVQVQYNCGMNSKPIDRNWFRYHYADLPSVYQQLMKIGYSKPLFRQLLIQHFQASNLRVILGSFRRWPMMTLQVMIPYLQLIGSSFWQDRIQHFTRSELHHV